MSKFIVTRRLRQMVISRIKADMTRMDAERAEYASNDTSSDAFYYDHTETNMDIELVVEDVRIFPKVNRWGDIGEMEVTYSSRGYRASYGFTVLGRVSCYAN